MSPDCLLDYPTTPSGKARGTSPSPRQLRPMFKKPEPNFPFARLAREFGGNATGFEEEDVEKDKSLQRKKSRDDTSALGAPCSAPNCIWRKATHYLLEDVQWLNHLVNSPGAKTSEAVQLKQEVASLRLEVEMLETKKHETAQETAMESQATEELISQIRAENNTLVDRIELSSQDIMLMRRELEQLKAELEHSEEKLRRVELTRTHEQEKHQEALHTARLEFENAALSVELLTDDKHRMLAMLETYRGKKGRRRSSTMSRAAGAKDHESGGEAKGKKEGRRRSVRSKK
eukprot:GEMP01046756.1.p1 GENE.GEMP01046756.1~~GEMP01046756.1.p1  ORF type:complete len:289 (+),score=84.36 GEMP01046756.1:88-954(+)